MKLKAPGRSEASLQRDVILSALMKNAGRYVHGRDLANAALITRAGVWKRIAVLKRKGFAIESDRQRGYCLKVIPDRLLPEIIAESFSPSVVGKNIVYHIELDSTNREAKRLALSGVQEGTVVVAEHQRRGRGRLDREWISTPYSSILCSVVLYPQIAADRVFRLTMMASIAVAQAIDAACGLKAEIKWPNDVYLSRKKVCGILTEFMAEHDAVRHVVIGIGINVNFDVQHRAELRSTATSLKQGCGGKKVSRLDVLRCLLEALDGLYLNFKDTGGAELKALWEARSMVLGRWVIIDSKGEVTCGRAKSISPDGCLFLEGEDGQERQIVCGDLSLRMEDGEK